MQQTTRYIVTDLGRDRTGVLSTEDNALVSSYVLHNLKYVKEENYKVFLDIYDLENNLLDTYVNLSEYRVTGVSQDGKVGQIEVNPVEDAEKAGYIDGVVLDYRVMQADLYDLFIHEISPSRLEVRCKSVYRTAEEIQTAASLIQTRLQQKDFTETYLKVGNSWNLITNVTLEFLQGDQVITFKLYKPLSFNYQEKSECIVYEKVGDGKRFSIEAQPVSQDREYPKLKGPNFNVDSVRSQLKDVAVTEYLTAKDLLSYVGNNNRVQNIYKSLNGITAGVEVDYSDFSSFIHFSSVLERLYNFDFKLSVLEEYEEKIQKIGEKNKSVAEVERIQKLIQGIKDGFDHYENFLYYGVGEYSTPKRTLDEKPYTPVQRSAPVQRGEDLYQKWFSRMEEKARTFDDTNNHILINTIPFAMRDDVVSRRGEEQVYSNEPLIIFVHMLGQHFDNEWIYAKALADRYKADNRLDFGIPKSLVREALEGFGLKIEDADQDLKALFESCNLDGTFEKGTELSVTDFLRATGTGVKEQPIGQEDYVREVYKRIYHNIPQLLKTKGTSRCLRTLINCFGIPEDILDVRVRGGLEIDTPVFFGPEGEVTTALDKVRISETQQSVPISFENNKVVTGSVLSRYTTVQPVVKTYSDDGPEVQIGFNLNRQPNQVIRERLDSFDIDDIIGDPRNVEENYSDAFKELRQKLVAGVSFRDPAAIIRLVRYIDSTLFRIIDNFLPARTSVSTGVIVEDNNLHRNRYKEVQVQVTEESYLGSVDMVDISGSSPGSFDLLQESREVPSGSWDGTWTVDYNKTVTTGELITEKEHSGERDRYTGELKGSEVQVEDWWLTRGNPFHKQIQPVERYTVNFYYEDLPTPAYCLIYGTYKYVGDYYRVEYNLDSSRVYVLKQKKGKKLEKTDVQELIKSGDIEVNYNQYNLELVAFSGSNLDPNKKVGFVGWFRAALSETGSDFNGFDTVEGGLNSGSYVTPSSKTVVKQGDEELWVAGHISTKEQARISFKLQQFTDIYEGHPDGQNRGRVVLTWKVTGDREVYDVVGKSILRFESGGKQYSLLISDRAIHGTSEGQENVLGTPEDWERWLEDPDSAQLVVIGGYDQGSITEYGTHELSGRRGPFKSGECFWDTNWWDTRRDEDKDRELEEILEIDEGTIGWTQES